MKATVLAILLLTSVGATAQPRDRLRECLIQPPVSPHPIFWIPRDKWCRMITTRPRLPQAGKREVETGLRRSRGMEPRLMMTISNQGKLLK